MQKNAEHNSYGNTIAKREGHRSQVTGGRERERHRLQGTGCTEDEGFVDVYKNYSDLVYRCILQIVCCEESSKDLMHDVFIRVLEDEGCLQEVNNIGGFLFMTARNIAIDHLRKQKRMNAILKEYSINTRHFYFDDEVVRKEFLARLHESVEGLPLQQRMVYRLSRELGMSREEIANELKIAENTVKEQMRKALGKLRVGIGN